MTHCCEQLADAVTFSCDKHTEPSECPDALVEYIPTFDEYGLVIHDGGRSKVTIHYCPWCGAALPESKRDRWFDELEERGLDPTSDELPAKYRGDAWYRPPAEE